MRVKKNCGPSKGRRRLWVTAVLTMGLGILAQPVGASSLSVASFDVSSTPKYKPAHHEPKAAWISNDQFVVSWAQLSPGSTEADPRWDMMVRRFDSNGAPLSPELRIASGRRLFAFDKSLTVRRLGESQYVVAWVDEGPEFGTGYDLYAQVFNADGMASSLRFPISLPFAGNQVHLDILPGAPGQFIALYRSINSATDGNDIYAQRFGVDGTPVGSSVRINSVTTGFQTRPSGACNVSGQCLMAWGSSASQDGSTPFEIKGQYLDANLTPIGTEVLLAAAPAGESLNFPSVAIDSSQNTVVAWGATPAAGGAVSALRFSRYRPNRTLKNSGTITAAGIVPDSIPHAVARPSGEIGFAWSAANSAGKRSQLFVRDYLVSGSVASTQKIADVPNTTTVVNATSLAVSPTGLAVVLWVENPASSSNNDSFFRGAILQGFGTP